MRKFTVAIVGAGSAGISVASRLIRKLPNAKGNIVIVDPSEKHYYQPLWTLVGGGEAKKEQTERLQETVIPTGVELVKEYVTQFHPEEKMIETSNGTIHYDYLVIAAGIQVNWNKIKGLKEAIGQNGVCSNYAYEYVDSTWDSIKNFRGGRAIFTSPNTPIKCGGAPQKIMYLAEQHFQKSGVRQKTEVVYAAASPSIFSVEKYRNTLEGIIEQRDIKTRFKRNLVEIDGEKKEATFELLETGEQEVLSYDMIHVTPPMSSPDFIANSPVADSAGWVDVDKYTLQHTVYPTIFSLGDCANLPTSKTGAAIRKQAPVVAENIVSHINSKPLTATYDGYTSCPLVTGYGSLVLAEFDYNNLPAETFPFDQSKERFSMYLLKKHALPMMYWKGMLKGIM